MNIPNLITLGRLVLVPFAVWLIISDAYGWALAVFIVAGVSDGIDGFLARRWNMHSELGAHLDPVADKALLVSVYVTLGLMKVIPAWLVITVVSRDVLILGALMISFVMANPVRIRPLMVSKINTAGQILFAVAVLAGLALGRDLGTAYWIGMFAVAVLTLASGTAYLVQWLAHMATGEDKT